MASSREGSELVPKVWRRSCWKGVWPFMDAWDSVRLRMASTHWNAPGKYGPYGELFFFLLKKEPMVVIEMVHVGTSISAETIKACTLVGLHMMAEEVVMRLDNDFPPDLGDEWRHGCPRSPVWSNRDLDGAGSEITSA